MNFRYKNSLYPIWIHESDFINMNSWYEIITENQWEFNILNSYCWIQWWIMNS